MRDWKEGSEKDKRQKQQPPGLPSCLCVLTQEDEYGQPVWEDIQHFLSPLVDLGWAHAAMILEGGKQLSCYTVCSTTLHIDLEMDH